MPAGTSLADALEVWDATGIDDPPAPFLDGLASGGPLSLERVAAFTGYLDAVQRDWVEVGILGQGGNLALHYHVAG